MLLVYLFGDPGVGKTTLLDGLIDRLATTTSERSDPITHELLWRQGFLVGAHLGSAHAGTDALPASVQPVATAWLAAHPFPLVLAEGDRLANRGFVQAMGTAGVDTQLVHVHCPADVAEARRAESGRHYPEAWLAARLTKVTRLAALADIQVDTSQPLGVCVAQLLTATGLDSQALTKGA